MSKNILIIDDNEMINSTIKDEIQVKHQDWDVISAHSGDEAFDLLKTKRVDLIVLDISMPNMDGWEVTTKLRETPKLSTTPIVFLSDKNDELSRELASKVTKYYVEKPLDIKKLYQTILEALNVLN